MIFAYILPVVVHATSWQAGEIVPKNGRSNPYELSMNDFAAAKRSGLLHALNYPVDISGAQIPLNPILNFLKNDESRTAAQHILGSVFQKISKINEFSDLERIVGLHTYPNTEGENSYFVPYKNGVRPSYAMGTSITEKNSVAAMTFSCAACHAGNLFGKRVMGLSNRFPKANDFFVKGLKLTKLIGPNTFHFVTGANSVEQDLYSEFKYNMNWVASKPPMAIGLDTSLRQVALSLAKRREDGVATRDYDNAKNPRSTYLDHRVADSKPAVWWNVKYKNKWLLDGSLISGNPIYTNFIWNEVGRGTDLVQLEQWLDQNEKIIEELTTAVFSSEAPKYSDFFDAKKFDFEAAKRGENIFEISCAKCHGHYIKNWDAENPIERMKTIQVVYHADTPIRDVGTDPNRYLGMQALEKPLNNLDISIKNGIKIKTQKGYVPPPLVGIWARWPYFHNNSAPSLCAVLTPAKDRPVSFWMREANDSQRDFDDECNGYPAVDVTTNKRTNQEYLFDTRKPGLSNAGHDERIFVIDGKNVLTQKNRIDLIRFLQTL